MSGLHGWKTIAESIDKFRTEFEKKLGAKVFLIGNEYQTSSMLSFYLKDKRNEGPGHPPVYIPESQDIQNQFSFWPRYDAFVEADPSAQRDTTFTEEAGVNPFIDRTALYVTDRPEASPPQNLQSAFTRWELRRRLQVGATRSALSRDSDLCAIPISDSAVVMTPQVSVIIPVYNEEGNVAQLQSELAWALKEISHELLFVDDGSRDRTIEQIKPDPRCADP